MRIALVIRPFTNENLQTALQMGVEDVVTVLPNAGPVWDYLAILRHKKRIEDQGLRWSVVESVPISDTIKLGLEGRDSEIDQYCQTIRNLGAAGIPVMCYNWMAVFNWMRTSMTTRTRGNALTSTYDHNDMEDAPRITQGLHPDDPPLSPIRGVARIITSPEAYDRVISFIPSEYNGLTYCQGNFKAMGADIPATIHHFKDHIHFAHFRDLHGQVPTFSESFHDDGDTDMAEAIRAYKAIGFKGVVRPDHTPTFAIDEEDTGGYNFLGRLYAVGYMRGLIHGTE